ncbi:hypothetical protein F5Y04DRAFT_255613 [Hypomontagnella monticulosa]|nr:hypothetical protein F5Y04DRAFT_255613 [Hypomontagnella monticulosa]
MRECQRVNNCLLLLDLFYFIFLSSLFKSIILQPILTGLVTLILSLNRICKFIKSVVAIGKIYSTSFTLFLMDDIAQ